MNKVKIGLVLIGIGIGLVAGAGSMYIVCAKRITQIDADGDAAISTACAIDDEEEVALKAYYEDREADILASHDDYRVRTRAEISRLNAEINSLKSPVEKKPRVRKSTKQKEEVLNNDSI